MGQLRNLKFTKYLSEWHGNFIVPNGGFAKFSGANVMKPNVWSIADSAGINALKFN